MNRVYEAKQEIPENQTTEPNNGASGQLKLFERMFISKKNMEAQFERISSWCWLDSVKYVKESRQQTDLSHQSTQARCRFNLDRLLSGVPQYFSVNIDDIKYVLMQPFMTLLSQAVNIKIGKIVYVYYIIHMRRACKPQSDSGSNQGSD